MKKTYLFLTFVTVVLFAAGVSGVYGNETILEPYTYSQNFETNELSAWESYPFWQDTAYDEKMRVNRIVPGDPNISIEEKVIPYSNVDQFAGAQKKLDMFLSPGSTISLRYYLKTQLAAEFLKVRIAGGPDGKVDFTVNLPSTNGWKTLTVGYNDFIKENPSLAGKNVKVNALAVFAKFPKGDPTMPIYFGLDDIVFQGSRAANFVFNSPEMVKLDEWKPYISKKHFRKGEVFSLSGKWTPEADKVTVEIAPYTDQAKTILKKDLSKSKDSWSLKSFNLNYPEGLYLGTITALKKGEKVSDTQFTFYIAPEITAGSHPRLWFDNTSLPALKAKLQTEKFAGVKKSILSTASERRKKTNPDSLKFDIDQYPPEEWLATFSGWFDRIHLFEEGTYYNAMAYTLFDDKEAGEYAKKLLVKISTFPTWLHPWMENRGRHMYYPLGELGMDIALTYDCVYNLLSPDERKIVQEAFFRNVIDGVHRTYVEDDLVISDTSNWVAHVTGGSLMCQAAMYGDSPDYTAMEPQFTGAIMKDYRLIQDTLDKDGAYGEGYGYYNFSMLSWSKSLPVIDNVLKVDMSAKLNKSYNELIWAGLIKKKDQFYFGDSGGGLGPLTNWAWLLPKYKEPLLGWFYNYLKRDETLMDALYETADVPKKDPFAENPVKLFRDVGTTVFKSGWNEDDFVFVMRTGPFVNHQHLDQGSFWLADRGKKFIDERHNSTYYDDPLYQPYYIQPIAHSTILIDGNKQSQRIGDQLYFADGFDDYAFVNHFLDSPKAAFSSGNIGRLYWGEVKDMSRNVLFLKPRTILMLDSVEPAGKDVDVTLLYQGHLLKDIKPGKDNSTIESGGDFLNVTHLFPENAIAKAEEMPHFIYTLTRGTNHEREGYLSLTARTSGSPLVIANILNVNGGEKPDIKSEKGDGFIKGTANGSNFAFSTKKGTVYTSGSVTTDALAVTWDGNSVFAAKCTSLDNGTLSLKSVKPVTVYISGGEIKYYVCADENVSLKLKAKPSSVMINGVKAKNFKWDSKTGSFEITLPAGEGTLNLK